MQNYNYVLETHDEDKYLEHFWLNFKRSIENYISAMRIYTNNENLDNKTLSEYTNVCSEILNNLKKGREYDKIKLVISKFIDNISLTYIKYFNEYHFSIFETNIKRWIKLDKSASKLSNIFLILKFGKNINKDEYLSSVLFNQQYNIYNIIDKFIKVNKMNYLSKLYVDDYKEYITPKIEKKFNIKIDKNTSFKKIILKIKL